MFDPEELNHKISQSFQNQEKVEAETQYFGNLINSKKNCDLSILQIYSICIKKKASHPTRQRLIY